MERPLYTPVVKARITAKAIEADGSEIDPSSLFAQTVVNAEALKKLIRMSLQERSQITLSELLERRPLEHGLAELITYWHLAGTEFDALVKEDILDNVFWENEDGQIKEARMPRVIFVR
jgi:hypothetical protein